MSAAKWRPPSKRAALLEAGAIAPAENPLVRCDLCNREQSADMVRDLRTLPPGLRKHFHDRDFVCDACTQRADLLGVLPEAVLFHHLGAPAELIPEHARTPRSRKSTPPSTT